jgi:hypothetical protein
MKLSDAQIELRASIAAGNAVLLTSSSGMGKSQMLYAEFEHLKAKNAEQGRTMGLGIIFAATQTPPDLVGFQFKGDRTYVREIPGPNGEKVKVEEKVTVSDPSVPLWMMSVPHGNDPGHMPAWYYDQFFLIIDEYGQGEADVKRACAEIFLNGGTAPWYLPQGSVRVAASNKGANYGVTKDFDFCIARRTEIPITPDIKGWLDYADKPYRHQGREWLVMPVTRAWAAIHPEVVFEPEPAKQGPWCNPRSLCAADRYLQAKAEASGGSVNPSDPNIIETLAGTIGMGATMSLMGHMQFALELPSYKTVIADPMGTPIPTRADLIMLMAYQLAGRTLANDLGPVVQYVQRLPKDMAVTFVSSLLRRNYKEMVAHPAMQGWIAKNATLVAVIASMSQN